MKVNLHTHTVRCGHARGTDEEYVLAAMENGFTKLGFSDHTPFPYEPELAARSPKMSLETFEEYISSINTLKEKYKGKIDILLGLECEPVERFFPFLREQRQRLDYLILGNHGDWTKDEPLSSELTRVEQLEYYVQTSVMGMESGLFLYLAHPELMLCSYHGMDDAAESLSRQLCREANRLRIPMEYNLYGTLKPVKPGTMGYPNLPFWQIAAEENVRAVVGVDAHKPMDFTLEDFDGAVRLLTSMGISVLEDPTLA